MTAGVRGLTSFTQEMADRGLVVGSRVLEMVELPATPEVASALEIADGETVVMRAAPARSATTSRSASRPPSCRPRACRDSSISAAHVPSLYEALKSHYGIFPQEAREVYRVGIVSADDAALLEVQAGSPAFIVQRITSDARGPFEYTVSTMRGDRYEIRSRLHL